MRFSTSTLIALAAAAILGIAPVACKKKGKGSSGGSGLNVEELRGLWTNAAQDMILQFSDKEYSSFGPGAISTECATTQAFKLSGMAIKVEKTDACKELAINVTKLDAGKLVVADGKNNIELDHVSSGTVKEIFSKRNLTKSQVPAPFQEFALDTAVTTTTTTTTTPGQFDTLPWEQLEGYNLNFVQATQKEDAYRPGGIAFSPWFAYRIFFQNGAVVRDPKSLSKNTGDSYCTVYFRYRILPKPEQTIINPGSLVLYSPLLPKLSLAKYVDADVGIDSDPNIDRISCRNHGATDQAQMNFGLITKAMGAYVNISKR